MDLTLDKPINDEVSEGQKLTALSNRRLSVKTFDTFEKRAYKIGWSLDRITLVGDLNKEALSVRFSDIGDAPISFKELGQLLEHYGFADIVGDNKIIMRDNWGENIAFVELVPFYDDKVRLDFNPNRLGNMLPMTLKKFIRFLFKDPHFSRADVACDVIDLPNEFVRQYQLADSTTSKFFHGRSGNLETAYWGASSSERQVRMYNKYIEQTKKREHVPEEINTWWRIEVQLRRDKANDWSEVMRETLDSFCSPHFMPDEIKATDRVMLTGLMADENLWGEISRPTKYKYRKMMKQISEHDELTKHMIETFDKSSHDLEKELLEWLRGINVADVA